MTTEDYCSFEVAKLLKEKGFNEPIRCWYDNFQDFHEEGVRMSNTDCLPPTIMCPTHQTAMKWLREVHNIIVSPYALSLGYYFEIFDLTTRDITGCKPLYQVGIPSKEYVLSTYKEAVEAGVKYVLENLI